jgi:Ca2+-binding RTX toxin-like protein
MMEVVLALVVVVVAIVGIMGLLPVGIKANQTSVNQTNAADAADQFLHFIRAEVRQDWEFLDAFPSDKPAGGDADVVWSSASLLDDAYVVISFDAVNEDDVFDVSTHSSGIFRVVQRTEDLTVDFTGVMRVWTDVTEYPDTGDAEKVLVYVEVSYPAEAPYDQRVKSEFSLEIFKPGAVSLDSGDELGDECITDNPLTPGSNVEGWGQLHPYVHLETGGGETLAYMEGMSPTVFVAPNSATRVPMGCVTAGLAFADSRSEAVRDHDYVFTFAPDMTVSVFSLTMLDNGDSNPARATSHKVSLVAYDADDAVVDADSYEWSSTNATAPGDGNGSPGDLQYSGDACGAAPGQPGNRTFVVTGSGIVKLKMEYEHNGDQSYANSDPGFALSDACFTIETEPSSVPDPSSGDPCASGTSVNINPANSGHMICIDNDNGTFIDKPTLLATTISEYSGTTPQLFFRSKATSKTIVVDGETVTLGNNEHVFISGGTINYKLFNSHPNHPDNSAMGYWYLCIEATGSSVVRDAATSLSPCSSAVSLPSCGSPGITVAGTVLAIVGTDTVDSIQVSEDGDQWKVNADLDGGNTMIEQSFDKSTVTSFYILGCDGDDQIQTQAVTVPCVIKGGGGDDQIQGGLGADEIHGDEGNDQLQGNDGDDTIYGGPGDDDLQGQNGNDNLNGGDGNDNEQQ